MLHICAEYSHAFLILKVFAISDKQSTGTVQLELQYAAETNALQPPHRFVPWVVVNGKPLADVSYIILFWFLMLR
jgi:hypothetical protein